MDDFRQLRAMGHALHAQQKFAEAVSSYRVALLLKPDYAEAFNDLGVSLLAQGEAEVAAHAFQRALALQPDDARAHNNLGVAYNKLRRHHEALISFQQALAIDLYFAEARLNIGETYFALHDFVLASRWCRLAIAVDPTLQRAHRTLALVWFSQSQLDAAHERRLLNYGNLFFNDLAPNTRPVVLMIGCAGRGNVPVEYLLPLHQYRLITWMIDRADEAQAASLPHYDIVFQVLGDPDLIDASMAKMQWFFSRNQRPVLNPPDRVMLSAREYAATRFAAIDHVLVSTTRCLPYTALAAAGLRFPLLIRPLATHGGAHMVKVDTPADLAALSTIEENVYSAHDYYYAALNEKSLALGPDASTCYVTEYVDYCSMDGYYRKYRIIFIDRIPYPYHLAISPYWLVHYETADMLSAGWKLAEELAFLRMPAQVLGSEAMGAIKAIGLALDLDYCGIDFSLLSDGRVLVFEANATMLVHPEASEGPLQRKNFYIQQIIDAFQAMLVKRSAINGSS